MLFRERVLVPKLRQFGFEVATTGRATEMHEAISKRLPDIILLDVGLPDSDGFDVARKLRAEHASIGIVMLTGHSGTANLVRGLSEGADAYLSKPVEIDVLVATLYSVARRLGPSLQVEGATWRLSSDEWFLLSPGGGKVRLSKAERRLLDALMKQPNEVILRESLIGALTDDITACISSSPTRITDSSPSQKSTGRSGGAASAGCRAWNGLRTDDLTLIIVALGALSPSLSTLGHLSFLLFSPSYLLNAPLNS